MKMCYDIPVKGNFVIFLKFNMQKLQHLIFNLAKGYSTLNNV